MSRVYIYVVDRDLGFAPNPFHGICSLATCKPDIRNTAKIDDWIIGVGGRRLKATGKCVFAMKVTRKISFNEYWNNEEFINKKPVRNGSKTMLLGDNIYHQKPNSNEWLQAHSHHSLQDGTVNVHNLKRDTNSHNVLLSSHFYYFGSSAPVIPENLTDDIGYKNGIGHRVFNADVAVSIVNWIEEEFKESLNIVVADPFNFDKSDAHYSVHTNKIS
jgi:hypothetical protein